jgi:hypothetical protein
MGYILIAAQGRFGRKLKGAARSARGTWDVHFPKSPYLYFVFSSFDSRKVNVSPKVLFKQELFVAELISQIMLRLIKLIQDKGNKSEIFRGYIYLAPRRFILSMLFLDMPDITVCKKDYVNVFAQQFF